MAEVGNRYTLVTHGGIVKLGHHTKYALHM